MFSEQNAQPQVSFNSQPNPNQPLCSPSALPLILPPNQQCYISSIITNTFSSSSQLVSGKAETVLIKSMRKLLIQYYLKLNTHQYVFYCAFFYLHRYISIVQNMDNGNHQNWDSMRKIDDLGINGNGVVPFVCLVLARKYMKGRAPNLDAWKQKIGVTFQNQRIRQLEDQIVMALDFQLQPTTRYTYMSDLFLLVNLSQKTQNFCSYLLDLSTLLTEAQTGQNSYQFNEAQIGISIIRLACHFFHPQELPKLSKSPLSKISTPDILHQCSSQIFQLLMNKNIETLRQVRHRYKRSKFMEVAKIEFFKIRKLGTSEKDVDTADEEDKNQEQKHKHNNKEERERRQEEQKGQQNENGDEFDGGRDKRESGPKQFIYA